MSVLQRIKDANAPGPPEDSLWLRGSVWTALVLSLWACASVGELSWWMATGASALLLAAMIYSFKTRAKPKRWLKAPIALAAVGSFVWFFIAVSHLSGIVSVSSVEAPLAILFTLIQIIHAWDVPARRDLLFSLAGSATLMAVAGAQATSSQFLVWVIPWVAFSVLALRATWASMSGATHIGLLSTAGLLGAIALAGLFAVAILPPPRASSTITFPESLGRALSVADPGGFAGGGTQGDLPAKAAPAGGHIAVGGYLGFAGPLDLAIRGHLGNTVVMRVRASYPSYFLGETYDTWSGQTWSNKQTVPRKITGQEPFSLPAEHLVNFSSEGVKTVRNIQTFYVEHPVPNLIFGSPRRVQLYFASRSIYVHSGHAYTSPYAMGKGTIYTVVSELPRPTLSQLEDTGMTGMLNPGFGLPRAERERDLELPHPYHRAHALAAKLAAGHKSILGVVRSMETWMHQHVRYSTDIPPLSAGVDAVNEFLFKERVGYCEQISTALVVMLRTLGIPAREAVGYVPGPYDPLTGMYDIEAKDAHAWAQVWFPGLGWENFDPTAHVPLAPPDPANVVLAGIGHALSGIPLLPTLPILGGLLALVALALWLTRRPRSWEEAAVRSIERTGKQHGRPRPENQTLGRYVASLESSGIEAEELQRIKRLTISLQEKAYSGGHQKP
jgi:transglutaminase-like putative cysteine protease